MSVTHRKRSACSLGGGRTSEDVFGNSYSALCRPIGLALGQLTNRVTTKSQVARRLGKDAAQGIGYQSSRFARPAGDCERAWELPAAHAFGRRSSRYLDGVRAVLAGKRYGWDFSLLNLAGTFQHSIEQYIRAQANIFR